MRCDRIQLPGGVTGIVCSRRSPRRPCQVAGCTSHRSIAQCDYPVTRKGGKAGTCDLYLCDSHRRPVLGVENTDYCPAHDARARQDSQRATQGRGAAAYADGAHHDSSTPTRGDADAALHPGGGTAAPRPVAEPPRVTSSPAEQLGLFAYRGGGHG